VLDLIAADRRRAGLFLIFVRCAAPSDDLNRRNLRLGRIVFPDGLALFGENAEKQRNTEKGSKKTFLRHLG
jgi:hypothetical protein